MIRLALVVVPVLLTVANAMAQVIVWDGISPVYQGQTTKFAVDPVPGDTYTWDIYNDSTVNFAFDDGTAIEDGQAILESGTLNGTSITVTWPEPGIYFYKVAAVDAAGCTNNLEVGRIWIREALPTAALRDTAICVGEPGVMTVDLTGHGPWEFTVTDGVNNYDFTTPAASDSIFEFTFTPGPITTTEYWVSVVSDIYGTNTEPSEKATIIVHPKPEISRIYQYDKP